MTIQLLVTKKIVLISLAAALTLSACADKDSATSQDDPALDPQTSIEQEATGVSDVEQATENVNSADISDEPLAVDPVAAENDTTVVTADEVADAEISDAEIMDGSEAEEHVSTY